MSDVVPIVLEGIVPDVFRVRSRLYSLDYALADTDKLQLGVPLRTVVELYGPKHSGKSSLAYYLAGMVRPTGNVILMDTESALDTKFLEKAFAQAKFGGKIHVVDYGKKVRGKDEIVARTHAEMATELADTLILPDTNAIVLDSVAGYRSTAEMEGVIGDANMGRRARDITQWSRRCLSHLIVHYDPPKMALMVNHSLAGLATQAGRYSPGGRGKGYASAFTTYMYRKDNDYKHGCFHAELIVEKHRWGGRTKESTAPVFVIPGMGISPDMTALLDCTKWGLATRGATVKVGDKSVGRIGTLVEAAMDGNSKKFEPFWEALDEHERNTIDTAGVGDSGSTAGAEGG